jgi:hypothetical protein
MPGIKYGFCSDVKSRRINLGRTNLICGRLAFVYSTDLTGTVTQSDIGAVSLDDVTAGLCLNNETGACPGIQGSFFTQTVSYNATLQNNPMTIGCCADHLVDEGKLINTAVGGVTTSREHTLSINGQGEPWSIDYQRVRDAINNAIDKLNVINIPHVPDGFYVPTSVDANLPGDTWQQGSGSWMYFEGLGTDMEIEAPLLTASEEEYTVSVNATTGRVDGSVSKTAYYTAGSDSIPCTPVDVGETVCNFAEALNGILFNN